MREQTRLRREMWRKVIDEMAEEFKSRGVRDYLTQACKFTGKKFGHSWQYMRQVYYDKKL